MTVATALDDGVRRRAGPHLLALAGARPAPLVSAVELTTRRARRSRAGAFALDFADGTRLKGRRFADAGRARLVARVLASRPRGFARPVGARGDALLVEWVRGVPLSSGPPVRDDLLRGCGAILAALHRTDPPAPPGDADPAEGIEARVRALADAGALAPALARRVLARASAGAPPAFDVGVRHRDFCAENLVLDRDGAPVCVDAGGLGVGPLDADLARALFLWPLGPRGFARFLEGYREVRPSDAFERHRVFWSIAALLGSAAWRTKVGAPGARGFLVALEALVA